RSVSGRRAGPVGRSESRSRTAPERRAAPGSRPGRASGSVVRPAFGLAAAPTAGGGWAGALRPPRLHSGHGSIAEHRTPAADSRVDSWRGVRHRVRPRRGYGALYAPTAVLIVTFHTGAGPAPAARRLRCESRGREAWASWRVFGAGGRRRIRGTASSVWR